MNPLVIRCSHLTKPINLPLSKTFLPCRAELKFTQKQWRRSYSDYKQNPSTNVELKGDLLFNDKQRNLLYLVGAGGLVVLVVGGVYWTLNSSYFESKLRFKEEDPEEWPIFFLEMIAIIAQLDPHSIPPKYIEILKKGCVHPNEEIRRACCSGLATLATDRKLNAQLASSLPLQKILASLQTSGSVEFLSSVVDLMDILSERGANAPLLVNKQNLVYVTDMCYHPKSEIKSKVSGMLANVSKNDEVTETMIRLIPALYYLHKNTEDNYTQTQVTIALNNILNSKIAKEKYENILKANIASAKIPEDQLKVFREYTEESAALHRVKAITSALIFGTLWSGARWGIHGYRKGLRGNELLSVLKNRTPKSAIGAAVVYSYFSLDDWIYTNVFEPKLNSESSVLGTYALSGTTMVAFLWASQAVAPFSFIPASIYPVYKFIVNGDRRYYEK